MNYFSTHLENCQHLSNFVKQVTLQTRSIVNTVNYSDSAPPAVNIPAAQATYQDLNRFLIWIVSLSPHFSTVPTLLKTQTVNYRNYTVLSATKLLSTLSCLNNKLHEQKQKHGKNTKDDGPGNKYCMLMLIKTIHQLLPLHYRQCRCFGQFKESHPALCSIIANTVLKKLVGYGSRTVLRNHSGSSLLDTGRQQKLIFLMPANLLFKSSDGGANKQSVPVFTFTVIKPFWNVQLVSTPRHVSVFIRIRMCGKASATCRAVVQGMIVSLNSQDLTEIIASFNLT